jgi:hypothetical protein
MGQMTDAAIGVSVSVPLNYSNIDLIMKLMEINNITLLISGLFTEPDEVINVDFDDTFDLDKLDELVKLKDQDEFNSKLNELDIKEGLIFNFMHICAGIYARNLRFREHSYVFQNDEHDTTPENLIKNIQKGVDKFREAGIEEDLIKIGNTMLDG